MSKSKFENDGGPSQRVLRVGENIRHALSDIFLRGEIRDPTLEGVSVTVTEVRCSPDLRNATIFVMPLAGKNEKKVVEGLKGKLIVKEVYKKIKQSNHLNRLVTLSPLTEMATRFHSGNGAKLLQVNETSQNFEYEIIK